MNSAAGESCGTATAAQSSYFTSDSSSQSSHIYKAKVPDTHLPSLKRRRLSEYKHNNCFHSSLISYITFQGCRVNPSLILNVLCSVILVLCSHEDPGESGMITICTEYECEVKESQKKPVNLLDALEQGGHCSGEDSNPVTGEVALETVLIHLSCYLPCQKKALLKITAYRGINS